jgi:hypothetical protein
LPINAHERPANTLTGSFANAIAEAVVVVTQGHPLTELSKVEYGDFDWLFLNDGFSYSETYTYLTTCNTRVKTRGVIVGSNYGSGSWWTNERYGVVEAVNLFCKTERWELAYLSHDADRCLTYAIKRMTSDQ